MKERLKNLIEKHSLLSDKMLDPNVFNNQKELLKITKEHSSLDQIVKLGKKYLSMLKTIQDDKKILEENDEELKEIAQEEIMDLEVELIDLEKELKILLLPKNPNDDKNLILEIRAGTGGEEAALFAANLYRIYTRYAERNNWVLKILNSTETGIGGIKEAIVSIKGDGAFGRLKYESGVHRVQRECQKQKLVVGSIHRQQQLLFYLRLKMLILILKIRILK